MFEQIQVGLASDTIGKNGQVISPSHMNDERNYPITVGRALQQHNIAVDASPTVSTVYSVTILGETVSIVSSGTQATDVTALVDALNANPIIRGVFTASDNGTTSVDLDANAYGTDVAVTVDDEDTGELILTEPTEPADATQINIGRAMYYDGSGGVTPTNPNSDNMDAFAGFSRLLEDAEQTSVAATAATTDLYEDREDVCVLKRGRMIVSTGAAANENDEIWVEQAAGANLGKAYNASGSTGSTLVITPTPGAAEDYVIQLNIDGEVVYVSYTGDGTDTAQEVVEGLKAELDADTPATLLTTTEDDATLTITLTDSDASLEYVLSDNLAGVANDGTTRLKLPMSKGKWAGPNKIDLKGGI